MLYDNRTKPNSQWTYYVVDDLPKMSNIYRYDTVEEAIAKYKSLPDHLLSAIGSSIDGRSEIDHIQRRDGTSVLVMDSERTSNPIWRDSPEIQESIDKMVAYLNVYRQLSNMFGFNYPSVAVELERYSSKDLENYFGNKILRPEKPGVLLSAVKEVCVEGEGWLKLNDFLSKLDQARPGRPGDPVKTLFVDQLNIDYIDETGRCGQADISPRNFVLLQKKTEFELSPEKLTEELYQLAENLGPYEARDYKDTKDAEMEHMRQEIAAGRINPYVKFLSASLSEGFASEEDHKKALSLMARLTVLTPSEFRKPALLTMIQQAEHKAANQQRISSPQRPKNKEH